MSEKDSPDGNAREGYSLKRRIRKASTARSIFPIQPRAVPQPAPAPDAARDRSLFGAVGAAGPEPELGPESLAEFTSENPNPVLRVRQDGTLLHANKASAPVLAAWNCSVGSSVPPFWHDLAAQALASEQRGDLEWECGETVYAMSVVPVGRHGHVNLYGVDITARRRAEKELRESVMLFDVTLERSQDGIMMTDANGIVTRWSAGAEKLSGYSRDETVGRTLWDVQFRSVPGDLKSPDLYANLKTSLEGALRTGTAPFLDRLSESVIEHPDGRRLTMQTSAFSFQTPGGFALAGILRNTTESKRTEESLRASELRFRTLIEQAPLAILMSRDGVGLYANREFARMTGLQSVEDTVGKPVSEYFPLRLQGESRERGRRRALGLPVPREFETVLLRSDGSEFPIQAAAAEVMLSDGMANLSFITDITARKRGEAESHALSEIMEAAALAASLPEFLEGVRQSLIRVLDAENLFVVFHDPRTGLFEEVFAVDKYDPPMPPSRLERSITSYVFRTGEPLLLKPADFDALRARGEVELVGTRPASWLGAPLKTPAGAIGVIAVQNYENPNSYSERDRAFLGSVAAQVALMVERKQAEGATRESEEKWRQLFAILPVGVSILDANRGITELNEALERILQMTAEDFQSRVHERRRYLRSDGTPMPAQELPSVRALQEGRIVEHVEVGVVKEDGGIRWTDVSAAPLPQPHGGCVVVTSDITERKRSQASLEKQLHRLSALRAIDAAISSSLDMRVSFNILLAQATNELHVDAAAVLLLNNVSNELEYAAGVGFRGRGITGLHLKIGDGYAGQAALERRIVTVPNAADVTRRFSRPDLIAEENFVGFFAAPLVAKGQIKGVLELFHRSRIHADADWFDFLDTLSEQAAIAIDSAQLFAELQRSNFELALAYDTTIEGWSRAMDLRDKETEGHTQRVSENAVKLGRAMGFAEHELTQLRRGALLHDIGKMGVPDAVLLKPGPLTDEEWVLMKQHPSFAYQMLSEVRYLQNAINIPYCHHEKWDGSGYPRGLKGEQIPLSARIFAIVDVYDALTSDRPYRAAWTSERAQEYIASESGRHFDPRVVQAFRKMMAQA